MGAFGLGFIAGVGERGTEIQKEREEERQKRLDAATKILTEFTLPGIKKEQATRNKTIKDVIGLAESTDQPIAVAKTALENFEGDRAKAFENLSLREKTVSDIPIEQQIEELRKQSAAQPSQFPSPAAALVQPERSKASRAIFGGGFTEQDAAAFDARAGLTPQQRQAAVSTPPPTPVEPATVVGQQVPQVPSPAGVTTPTTTGRLSSGLPPLRITPEERLDIDRAVQNASPFTKDVRSADGTILTFAPARDARGNELFSTLTTEDFNSSRDINKALSHAGEVSSEISSILPAAGLGEFKQPSELEINRLADLAIENPAATRQMFSFFRASLLDSELGFGEEEEASRQAVFNDIILSTAEQVSQASSEQGNAVEQRMLRNNATPENAAIAGREAGFRNVGEILNRLNFKDKRVFLAGLSLIAQRDAAKRAEEAALTEQDTIDQAAGEGAKDVVPSVARPTDEIVVSDTTRIEEGNEQTTRAFETLELISSSRKQLAELEEGVKPAEVITKDKFGRTTFGFSAFTSRGERATLRNRGINTLKSNFRNLTEQERAFVLERATDEEKNIIEEIINDEKLEEKDVNIVSQAEDLFFKRNDDEPVDEFIRTNEGVRTFVEDEQVGSETVPTVGIGFNLDRGDADEILKEAGLDEVKIKEIREGNIALNDKEIEDIFGLSLKIAVEDADEIFPNFSELPKDAQTVITDVLFNVGKNKFLEFEGFIEAINTGDFVRAAEELEFADPDAKDKGKTPLFEQTGRRARRNIRLLNRTAP